MRMLIPTPVGLAWPRRTLSPLAVGDLFEDFDNIVESFLRPTSANTVNFQLSCDVNETKEHYLVSFDMPGVKPEDIRIEVKGTELVISGERKQEVRGQGGEATPRYERMYGKYERTFNLPTTIATDKIEAHYENGVLNVAIPKAEVPQARTIQVQTGKTGLLDKLLGSKKDPSNTDSKDVKHS